MEWENAVDPRGLASLCQGLREEAGHTTGGVSQSSKGPQSSGYRATAGMGRKDDAGARKKGARRSHKLRHTRPKRETEGGSEFGSHFHILSCRGKDWP